MTRIPSALLALHIALALVPARALADESLERSFPCVGRWTGTGQNTGFPSSWTIDMVVRPPDEAGRCGTIEYTNPACGGTMEACTHEGGLVRVRERYTHTGECAPPARLEFRCSGDRMEWAWVGWEVARSTLTRVGPAPSPSEPSPSVPSPSVPSPSVPSPSVPSPNGSTESAGGPGPRADRLTPAEPSGRFGCAVGAPRSAGLRTFGALGLLALAMRARRRR